MIILDLFHLLEYLLSKNYEVKALIRKEEDKKTFRFDTKNVQWIVGDVLDINVIDEALKGVEKVMVISPDAATE